MNLVFQILVLLGIGEGVMNSRMNPPPLGLLLVETQSDNEITQIW